jgi:hypothetical protein
MQALTLLQIVQTICDELGLNRPTVIVNATDTQVRQIYSLVNRSLRELQQNYNWTFLQTEFDLTVAQPTVTTGNTTSQSPILSNIPSTTFLAPFPTTWVVSGQNIPVNSRVLSIVDPNTVTISQPASASLVGETLTFSRDTYPIPSDFSRYINQTWWDRTNRWALMGPDSPQVDQWHRSGIVTIGPRRHFRQIGYVGYPDFNSDFNIDFSSTTSVYRIWPPPGAADTPINLVYEYISQNMCLSRTLTPQPNFIADTDLSLCDPQMLILDTKWRFWQIKGFDYLPMQMEARDYIDRAYGNDGGAKTLSITNKRFNMALTTGLVQDGNYPGTSGV